MFAFALSNNWQTIQNIFSRNTPITLWHIMPAWYVFTFFVVDVFIKFQERWQEFEIRRTSSLLAKYIHQQLAYKFRSAPFNPSIFSCEVEYNKCCATSVWYYLNKVWLLNILELLPSASFRLRDKKYLLGNSSVISSIPSSNGYKTNSLSTTLRSAPADLYFNIERESSSTNIICRLTNQRTSPLEWWNYYPSFTAKLPDKNPSLVFPNRETIQYSSNGQ